MRQKFVCYQNMSKLNRVGHLEEISKLIFIEVGPGVKVSAVGALKGRQDSSFGLFPDRQIDELVPDGVFGLAVARKRVEGVF